MSSFDITATVAKSFDVTLYSHGGTGYSWAQTGLPGCIALTDIASQQVVPLNGGAVRTIFTFLGLKEGSGALTFSLIRPWEPAAAADERSYQVTVNLCDVEGAMASAAGNAHFPPVVFSECSGEHEGKAVIQSDKNCTLKYGIPPHDKNCNLKYGFPISVLYAVHPPIARYMAQPPRK
ncbi:MAG: protease inhibitor I42 family protein [Myxococcales bacterium]